MRLIDADALIAEQCDGACEMFDGEKCLACKADCHCDLREAIDNAPTLDYAPVRHGEWIPQDDTFTRFVCSVCEGRTVKIKYCPNCGAMMDGKEKAHG